MSGSQEHHQIRVMRLGTRQPATLRTPDDFGGMAGSVELQFPRRGDIQGRFAFVGVANTPMSKSAVS